jgi:hypothetical protein
MLADVWDDIPPVVFLAIVAVVAAGASIYLYSVGQMLAMWLLLGIVGVAVVVGVARGLLSSGF